jgi:hypothetical protein
MVLRIGMMRNRLLFSIVLIGVALSTPAAAQMNMPMNPPPASEKPKIPTISADRSKAKSLPRPAESGMRGFGTRAVEGGTLAEMKARCAASGLSTIEMARCDQLRRAFKTTPGNTR